MHVELTDIYDNEFFARHKPWKPEYFKLADAIYGGWQPESVCDFGCGNGYLLEGLKKLNPDLKIHGIEGSHVAGEYWDASIRDHCEVFDLRNLIQLWGRGGSIEPIKVDIGICLEVAEHIEQKHERTLIENIVRNVENVIIFSAAKPGESGDWHVNLQPQSHWIHLFAQYGWMVSTSSTNRLRWIAADFKNLRWLHENLIVFVPALKAEVGFNE